MGRHWVGIALVALVIAGTAVAQTPVPAAPIAAPPFVPPSVPPSPPAPMPPAPVQPKAVICTETGACDAACKDGAGVVEACVRFGELALSGRKAAPDPARALRAFRAACAVDEELRPVRERPGYAPGCLALWELLDRGWLFDVERSPLKAATILDRTIAIGRTSCTDTDSSGCYAAAKAVHARDRNLPPAKADVLGRIALAERGCTKGRQLAACQHLSEASWSLEVIESFKAEAARLRSVAAAGMAAACTTDEDVLSCSKVEIRLDGAQRAAVRNVMEKKCKEGDKTACAAIQMDLIVKYRREPEKVTAAAKMLISLCVGDGHPLCSSVAEALLDPGKAKRLNITIDLVAGLALAAHRCDLGEADGCRLAAAALGAPQPPASKIFPAPPNPILPSGPVPAPGTTGAGSAAPPAGAGSATTPVVPSAPRLPPDPVAARGYADRACTLTRPDRSCRECKADATLPSCQLRLAFSDHEQCYSGTAGACERAALRSTQGRGVPASIERAADYLRRGCDAAERGACVALDELCATNASLPTSLCQQALIHSDLFYEAEYQLGAGGDADLITADASETPNAKGPAPVTLGSVVAAAPTSIHRGKLDADLVVNVVLDRVRQAAIQLVVSQLLTAERKARYRYLRDLLEQGAALIAQPSTLRREKFQDLGMIVVRAFVAANLIDGLYPTGGALMASQHIGATVARGQKDLGVVERGPLPGPVKGYLVDVAYYWLGETRLFGRPGGNAARSLACPWSTGQGAVLCTQLAERAMAERVIGVDRVLDGLRLCKALREGGFDDLRRLIEASARSRTIADFGSTAGLTLDQWRARLVEGTRRRLDGVRTGLVDIRTLVHPAAFGENGLDLATLGARARNAREALSSPAVRLLIGTESSGHLMRLTAMIERASRDAEADESSGADDVSGLIATMPSSAKPMPALPKGKKPAKPAADSTIGESIDADALILAKLRQDATIVLSSWTTRDMDDLGKRIDQINLKVDAVYPTVDRLEAATADIASLFARYPSPDGTASLDVGNLPLYATPDLARELRSASQALVALDDGLRSLFPGEVNAQVRFSRSATVRLVGFLDLMERVARSSKLTQKTGDVIAALRMLGTFQLGVFDAPLYDVLEPVIDSIKTHEPMNLEMLYAVIAHVRLDTLIGALQGGGNPCKNEGSVDCWTTRLVHALQESVEQDGSGGIRIDGGKFAQRLAQHGDDFRRQHKWRGYLHLTVGVGGLYSDPVEDMGAASRTVPLISEQIGAGLASPSFLGDRLTFKVGIAASGLLYRAALDSAESNAIMVHPVFFALDIGDLVEAYVSPGMLMLYPPEDGRGTQVRWGFSAGISVPLTAYLERL
jgi:TPR repeat protein